AEPVPDVVQAPLHDAQQHLAGVLRRARGELEVAAELPLEDAVEALQLLLLAQPDAVFARLAAAEGVHARRLVAPLDGALGALTTAALEVELDALPAAEFALVVELACHAGSVLSTQYPVLSRQDSGPGRAFHAVLGTGY